MLEGEWANDEFFLDLPGIKVERSRQFSGRGRGLLCRQAGSERDRESQSGPGREGRNTDADFFLWHARAQGLIAEVYPERARGARVWDRVVPAVAVLGGHGRSRTVPKCLSAGK